MDRGMTTEDLNSKSLETGANTQVILPDEKSTFNRSKNSKKNNLFLNRFATILLVQSKLLPPSALGIKDQNNLQKQ